MVFGILEVLLINQCYHNVFGNTITIAPNN